MPIPLRLEDFGGPEPFPRSPNRLPNLDQIKPEDPAVHTLEAFDKGYSAGWDDATKAAQSETAASDLSLRQNLEDLGFTYHEARVHVMGALSPLLIGIVRKILPKLVQDTLGQRLIEEVEAMVDKSIDLPIDLMVSPSDAPVLRPVVDAVTTLPLQLVEETSMAPGQVFLRIGKAEREIDLSGALDAISESLTTLDTLNKETLRHG